MKEHCSTAIDFKIEIPFVDVVTGSEEEFNTTVCADVILMFPGHSSNVSVLDSEDYVNIVVIVKDLGLSSGKVLGFVLNEVFQFKRLDILPRLFEPVAVNFNRAGDFFCSVFHFV